VAMTRTHGKTGTTIEIRISESWQAGIYTHNPQNNQR